MDGWTGGWVVRLVDGQTDGHLLSKEVGLEVNEEKTKHTLSHHQNVGKNHDKDT
jgi:hypothetical protein